MAPTGQAHEPSLHRKIDDKKLAYDYSPPKTDTDVPGKL